MQCSILASDLIARSGIDTCGGIVDHSIVEQLTNNAE